MTSPRLSKSRLNAYRQCPKRLWLEVHKPAEKVESADVLGRFAVGHQVGEIAQRDYPDGLLIAPDNNLAQAIVQTRELLPQGKPLFEATFQHDGLLIRADLLLPLGAGWHMAEVKSTASAKDYHFGDLATQVWAAQSEGVTISLATVRHIDTSFELKREGDYRGLLMDSDAGPQVAELLPQVPTDVAQARHTLEGAEPQLDMGDHCNDPFECPFQAYCGSGLPPGPSYPVTLLPNADGKALARRLRAEGLDDLAKVPADRIGSLSLRRIHAATVTGRPFWDPAGAAVAMKGWTWPRCFLDFETIGAAVPMWVGCHPFEQVPFQFSCHRMTRDGSLTHTGFLDLSGANPGRACAEALLAAVGERGAIIAYNAGFERRCIRALAHKHPDLAAALLAVEKRVVDLLPVVRNHYYHRDMLGSFSIKAVLPTLVPDLSYETLEGVQDGTMAQGAYLEAISGTCAPERRREIEAQLQKYCELDSYAMVRLAQALVGAPA